MPSVPIAPMQHSLTRKSEQHLINYQRFLLFRFPLSSPLLFSPQLTTRPYAISCYMWSFSLKKYVIIHDPRRQTANRWVWWIAQNFSFSFFFFLFLSPRKWRPRIFCCNKYVWIHRDTIKYPLELRSTSGYVFYFSTLERTWHVRCKLLQVEWKSLRHCWANILPLLMLVLA